MSTSAEQAAGIPPVTQPVRGRPPAASAASLAESLVDRAPDGPGWSPLRRHRSGRVIAGVSIGIAEHLGVPVLWVRVIFVVLAGLGGAGLVGYILLWVLVPATDSGAGRPTTARERQQAVGLLVLGIGLALAGAALGSAWGGWVTGPLGIALVGAGVVWREADASQRTRWRSGAGVLLGGGKMALLRVLAGIALVTSGIAVFLVNQDNLGQLRFALLAVAATLVGVAVLTVPWWLRLMSVLGEERRARIRTEERAEIAAHLHDSVLQTLALIQQQSDSAREVRRLARGQERELRSWLYGPRGYGRSVPHSADDDTAVAAFAATLHAAAGEVEDTYAVSVQVVVVGDCVLEEPLTALVQASREAMVNAAKHAGVAEVSVYAEVEPGQVHVFVRDRGTGFDPAAVADDRHGLADSIRGRMERHGGTVTLRTAPGAGTEIQLAIARRAGGEES
ncbi:MAG TPA: PspC domain-containing protein [Pseudonocardiaceae bacterium]|nr:PspC domain-containing protein [Pseudonocardiaceae bacterium]